jgi:UDP-glucose 4-epimerase
VEAWYRRSVSGRRPEPTFSSALVTGANGFLGRALVRRLAATGVDVTATSRSAVPVDDRVARVVLGDVIDPDFVRPLVAEAGADVVFHLAARVNGRRTMDEVGPMLRANLIGAVNMLEAATDAGCRRLVLTGSNEEPLGAGPACSPYAAAKASQAVYAGLFHGLYDTPVTIARVCMVYGPDQPDEAKVVPHTITSLLRGDAPPLSSGRRRSDWVYVDDVVDALVCLAQSPNVEGQAVDVGTGVLRSVRDVVETIVTLMEASVRPAWGAVPDRPSEAERAADVTAAHRLIGWSSSTDLKTGLARTVEWYRSARRR